MKFIFIMLFLSAVIGVLSACNIQQDNAGSSNNAHKSVKPNVVFILVDDLGYADVGAYNPDTFYETPNIDRFAAQSVVFTDGYAANPVCSPTRAALMSGKHPTRLAATDWFHRPGASHNSQRFRAAEMNEFMPLEEFTLAESFKENGYATAFIGKWHLGHEERYWPEHQGFDVNIGGHSMGMPLGGYFSPYKNPRLDNGASGEYLTERLTSEAINLIDVFNAESKPFFLYLSYYTVHTPLQAQPKKIARYKSKSKTLDRSSDFLNEDQYWLTDASRKVRVKQSHAIYAAMVEHMDESVGKVLKKLDDLGLDENTIVVFTSDNGGLSTAEGHPTSNLPLRGGKGWLYEGGVRVPLIVKAPGLKANGTKNNTQIISMDFYPTLLALTGLKQKPQQHVDGMNFSAALNGEKMEERALFFHYPHYSNQGGFPGAAVRLGDWKLYQNFEDGEFSLYNLANDISEQKNLIDLNPEKRAELKSYLNHWYGDVGARCLRPLVKVDAKTPWCYK